ncbi:MAG: DUF853 family protein, partial [Candidatus Eremiobacteraeota bacterium]|nr:DUF853 family protein [Candidatus Eremiobacteraeota bacterium]
KKLELGRQLDGQPCSYDPDHLVTHGLIFGMTGSGKTGLSVTILEELVLAGVPLLLIDPKGDLPNLGLVFPNLDAASFEPWVDRDAAQRAGLDPNTAAASTAERWRTGLEEWGIAGQRLAELKSKMALTVYTPGSEAGQPVNLLGAFRCPDSQVLADASARTELAAGTVTGLLSLVGVEADPVRDPRHIVLVQILDEAWEKGEDLDLEGIITRLVDPPFKKVGVFPLDSFFAPDDRMKLAMALNGVLASPSFASWMKGSPLDIAALTATGSGKVPVSVFYLAHLNEQERQFFVSLFMERVLAWSRSLPGSSGLRALVYFDEVSGYLPPHPANPASKKPILTLMKQSRAVGVGMLLATQNPVDVDYKAISNAGSWWIGRLQTAQDRDRILDGLMSAAGGLDREALKTFFDQLKPRLFMLKEASKEKPVLYNVRWAMSYLRGPVTGAELAKLATASPPVDNLPGPASPQLEQSAGGSSNPPPVPTGYSNLFLDPNSVFSARLEGLFADFAEPRRADGKLLYRPALHGELQLRFDERQGGFTLDEHHHRLYFPLDKGLQANSSRALFEADDLMTSPHPDGVFEPLPEILDEDKELKAARDQLLNDIYRNVSRGQWVNAELKLYGREGESREDFEARCQQAINERVDAQVAKLQDRYDKEVKRLEERINRQKQRVAELEATASGRRTEQLFQVGEMLLGMFTKRRRGTISGALSKHRMSSNAKLRAEHAGDDLSELEAKMHDLADQLQRETEAIEDKENKALAAIEERQVRLDKSDVRLVNFGILWVPVSRRL